MRVDRITILAKMRGNDGEAIARRLARVLEEAGVRVIKLQHSRTDVSADAQPGKLTVAQQRRQLRL